MQFRLIPKLGAFTKLIVLISFILLLSFDKYCFLVAKANDELLLNQYPGALAAYSLRKLDSNYSGPAIRVRRDTDNGEIDIGFDAEGKLDKIALESFLGLGNTTLPGSIAPFEAGYSIRRIDSSYPGAALRVRRDSDDALQDIGFDSNGEIDKVALEDFLADAYANAPYNDTLPLDTTAANAAYGLRKLSSSYTAAAVRIRRDSDNAESNIGFDVNGEIDTAAIENFCELSNCFVKTWYDQSGSGNHAEQTSHNSQPVIYDLALGQILNSHNKAAVEFRGSGQSTFTSIEDYFLLNNLNSQSQIWLIDDLDNENGHTIHALLGDDSTGPHTYLFITSSNLGYPISFDGSSGEQGSYSLNGSSLSPLGTNNISGSLGTQRFPDSISVLYTEFQNSHNWEDLGVLDSGTGDNERAGAYKLSEVILFNSALSAGERVNIEGNLGKYYQVPFSNGFVETWYDQSGNGFHATETTHNNQAQISINGENKVEIEYDGVNDRLVGPSTSSLATNAASIFSIYTPNNTDGGVCGAFESNRRLYIRYQSSTARGGVLNRNNIDIAGTENIVNRKTLSTLTGVANNFSNLYTNSILEDTDSLGNYSFTALNFELGKMNSNYMSGTIDEIIVYGSDQSVNRTIIESSMNNHHKIYSNAYISTWYDQSGNGNDAVQTVHSLQPLIYDANNGLIIDKNNLAAIKSDGIDDILVTALAFPATHSVFATAIRKEQSLNAASAVRPIVSGDGVDVVSYGTLKEDNNNRFSLDIFQNSSRLTSIPASFENNQQINFSVISNAGNFKAFIDDQSYSDTQTALGTNYGNIFLFGEPSNAARYFAGLTSEVIIYGSDQTNLQAAISSKISNFYHPPITIQNFEQLKAKRKNISKLKSKQLEQKVFEQLDLNQNHKIDFNDLIRNIVLLNKAQKVGTEKLQVEDLQQVDVDDNGVFDYTDIKLIGFGLSSNPDYDYAHELITTIKTNPRGDINFKAAKKFIRNYRRQKRRFNKLNSNNKASSEPLTLTESMQLIDCNKDNSIDKNDKICAVDFIREVLRVRYSEARVDKFLRRNKFKT